MIWGALGQFSLGQYAEAGAEWVPGVPGVIPIVPGDRYTYEFYDRVCVVMADDRLVTAPGYGDRMVTSPGALRTVTSQVPKREVTVGV
jgi:hypothetical protein